MGYDFDDFKRLANALQERHAKAIDTCEEEGKEKAKAEVEYHKQLAIWVGRLRPQGATVAETLAKGEPDVALAKETLHIAEAKERAALQRVRLAEADRAQILTMGAWSKSQQGWERDQ